MTDYDYLPAFREQRYAAKQRGIAFLLTFEEWFEIWQTSGKLHMRGRLRGQWVMGRRGDKGAYEVGNVQIIGMGKNSSDAQRRRWRKPRVVECAVAAIPP